MAYNQGECENVNKIFGIDTYLIPPLQPSQSVSYGTVPDVLDTATL